MRCAIKHDANLTIIPPCTESDVAELHRSALVLAVEATPQASLLFEGRERSEQVVISGM